MTPTPEPTPTLLEILSSDADHFDHLALDADIRERGSNLAKSYRARAARIRAAATRLGAELTKANTRWHETTSTACRELLLRINGGPR